MLLRGGHRPVNLVATCARLTALGPWMIAVLRMAGCAARFVHVANIVRVMTVGAAPMGFGLARRQRGLVFMTPCTGRHRLLTKVVRTMAVRAGIVPFKQRVGLVMARRAGGFGIASDTVSGMAGGATFMRDMSVALLMAVCTQRLGDRLCVVRLMTIGALLIRMNLRRGYAALPLTVAVKALPRGRLR